MLKRIYLFVVAVLAVAALNAQVTTSSITGTVKGTDGAPLSGATVTATHTPTGTKYVGTTNESGRINLANMRVGGPYRVEVTYAGNTPNVQDDIYLELGQPYILNVMMASGQAMEEVVVVGRGNALLRKDRIGTATTVSRAQIDNLPSITRSVNDLTRLTPQANGTAVGGGNYRSNNFTVDGANFNNQFGIGQNVPAQGSPISLDALEQISVSLTPYDVRQTGFTGASINAVTRSGRNEFFGTAFMTYRDDKMQGTRIGNTFAPLQSLKINQYGFSIGGPIIRNKLFFFVNLEQQKTIQPGPSKVAATPGAPFGSASYVARPTADSLNMISKYLKDTYGYETGPYQGYSNESNNNKLFGRLDWNINNNHKVNFRYSQVESKVPSQVSTSTTNSGISFSGTTNRQSINALHFMNSNYFQEDNLYSGTFEYIGRLGSYNHSFRASKVHQFAPRSSPGSEFPLVDILQNIGTTQTVYTTFGYEPFTFGNLRDVNTTTLNYDGNYVLGAHNLTGGFQYETSTTKNGFQRFGTGYYVFNSWNDFITNQKPINYALTYPLTADGSQAFPSFKFSQFSLYLQDDWTVTNKFKLMGGIRLELPSYPGVEEIKTHPMVANLNYAPLPSGGDSTKINTGALPKTQVMISPRFGFNYDILGDRSIVLRGGSGVFTGRIPYVWIVSQSGDAGMLQYLQTYQAGNPNMPSFNPDIKANFPNPIATPGTSIPSSISAMSSTLKFPSTWKSSLAADFRLPLGLIATLEGIYNKDINSVIARNMNLVTPTAMAISGYPDTRAIYPVSSARYINRLTSAGQPSASGTGFADAIVMDNVKGGNYWSLTAQLTKVMEKGFSGMIAYTLSGGKNYGDGSGDQIANLWSIPYNTSGNSNIPELSFTDNILPHRLVGSVTYANRWIANLKTSMTLFYSGSHIGRYSFYYTRDFNRDNQTNDLIYVPKDPSEITFVATGTSGYAKNYTPQEQSDIFFALIEKDPYLRSRKGQYAERNGALMPWRNQFDFHLSQELFSGIGGLKNSLEVFWDVFNIGNLFNSNWGKYQIANNGILDPQNMSSVTPTGTTKPTFKLAPTNGDIIRDRFRDNQTTTSTYYMQVGVRLNFN